MHGRAGARSQALASEMQAVAVSAGYSRSKREAGEAEPMLAPHPSHFHFYYPSEVTDSADQAGIRGGEKGNHKREGEEERRREGEES